MKTSEISQLLLDAAGLGIRLYSWQRRLIDDCSRFRVVLKSRAVGGSFTIALEALTQSLLHDNSTALVVSYSLRQSVEVFRKMRSLVSSLRRVRISEGGAVYVLDTVVRESGSYLELGNGSRVVSLPNNPDAIRGYRADFVYVDEAGMFRDDSGLKAAVMLTTAARNGRVTLVSTPKGKRGWFYEAYKDAMEKGTWSLHRIHYSMAPHISREDVEALRKTLNPLEWAQEMELEFLDEENAAFPYEVILSCVSDYTPKPHETDNPVYVGIDFGRYRDATVITAVERTGEEKLRIILTRELRNQDFNTQLATILDLINSLNPAAVYVDKTGLGIPLYEMLSRKAGQIIGVTITAAVKEALVVTLSNAMRSGRLVIPASEEKLITQLRVFRAVQHGPRLGYGAGGREHDDYVISLALAVYAASRHGEDEAMAARFWSWG